MYAVVVTFQIKEGCMDSFLPLMAQNAQTSLTQEVGCQRFDVCTDPATPDEVLLYEIYSDRAAFDAHLTSEHFKTFDARVAPMVADKGLRTYSKVTS